MALGKAANLVAERAPRARDLGRAVRGAVGVRAAAAVCRARRARRRSGRASRRGLRQLRVGEWLGRPAVATALTMMAPLFWMTASRPMSDIAGLAVSLAAQAILADGHRPRSVRPRPPGESPSSAGGGPVGPAHPARRLRVGGGHRVPVAGRVADAAAARRWRLLDRAGRGAAGRAHRQSRLAGRGHAAVVRAAGRRQRRPGRVLRRLQRAGRRGLVGRRPAGQRLHGSRAGLRALRDVHPPLGRRRMVRRPACGDRRRGPALARPARAAGDHRRRSCRTRSSTCSSRKP